MNVRVREPRYDTAAAEIHPLRPRKHGLVRPDTADDTIAGNGQARRRRDGRIESPDDATVENHRRRAIYAPAGDPGLA